jgi:hypothetical protein
MFVPVECSQCGKPFQVPDATIGKSTTCPWCQATVLALAVGRQPLPDVSANTPIRAGLNRSVESEKPETKELSGPLQLEARPEPLSLDDDPLPPTGEVPASAVSRPASRTNRRTIVLAVLFGLLLAGATTTITLGILRYKQGYVLSMEWKEFTPPDGSCGVDLLGDAKEADSDPEHSERRYLSEGWYSGTFAWIGWRNLTAAQTQEATSEKGWVRFEAIFDAERDRLKGKFGGYIAREATISQNPITKELRLDGQKSTVIERMIVMPEGPRPRIYFIGMAGRRLNLDGPQVKQLFDSFRVYD